ncbi:MAG: M48 family metallopeptidase [Candidatus Hydrogenedentes bacterium]|nr:M48 family metallopeptidase [Candidatus Hydrogenedentota bacterium]
MPDQRGQPAAKQLEFHWESRRESASEVAPESAASAPRDTASLRRDLENQTGLTIQLTITDNTSTLMTVRRDSAKAHATLRLHRMFLQAHGPALNALAAWVKNPRQHARNPMLGAFMRDNRLQIRKRTDSAVELRTRGTQYDLQELFDEVNSAQFAGKIQAKITWGRMPASRRRRRSIRFGSYLAEEDLIRIHPLLDQDFVPRYFIRYIVFHEMLHADVGIKTSSSGRRDVHSPEFTRREKAYPDYARAVAWQDHPAHLRKLLR